MEVSASTEREEERSYGGNKVIKGIKGAPTLCKAHIDVIVLIAEVRSTRRPVSQLRVENWRRISRSKHALRGGMKCPKSKET